MAGSKLVPGLYQIDDINGSIRGEKRRVEIISAVIEIIGQQGVDALSSQEVCRKTGMARSHVTYYFPKIRDLLIGAVGYVIHHGQVLTVQSLACAYNPDEILAAYVRGTWRWFEESPDHAAVLGQLHAMGATGEEPFISLNKVFRTRSEERFFAILKAMKPNGKPSQIKKIARLSRELLVGAITNFYATKTSEKSHQVQARIMSGILAMLGSVEE